MKPSETIFENLYSLLSQTMQLDDEGLPTQTPAFLTTSRRLPQVSNVGTAIQPAMYILQGEQDVSEQQNLGYAMYEMHAAAVVFFRNTVGPNGIASTQMNALRDAFIYQLQCNTLKADGVTVTPLAQGHKQHLGGVVYHARVKGRILANEGLLNNQGAIVFPISILSGM